MLQDINIQECGIFKYVYHFPSITILKAKSGKLNFIFNSAQYLLQSYNIKKIRNI